MNKRGFLLVVLTMLALAAFVATWVAIADTGYQQDCRTVYVDGVKCTGCSRCYEPRRVGTDDAGKIAPWEFSGEGWSQAEQSIARISISSQLIVNGIPVDSDSKVATGASYVHSSGYATGGDWWECVYTSSHDFTVKTTSEFTTTAGWSSKSNK